MSPEEQLIKVFYTSFQNLDWRGMLACYRDDVFFYDPVFENLQGPEVRAMWEMLLSRAKDLKLQFSDIQSDGQYVSCHWTATYTFTQTGRLVVNRVTARFTIHEGKIVEHYDDFSLWRWSRQALGWTGLLFGWSSLFQRAIRRNVRKSLDRFIQTTTYVQS